MKKIFSINSLLNNYFDKDLKFGIKSTSITIGVLFILMLFLYLASPFQKTIVNKLDDYIVNGPLIKTDNSIVVTDTSYTLKQIVKKLPKLKDFEDYEISYEVTCIECLDTTIIISDFCGLDYDLKEQEFTSKIPPNANSLKISGVFNTLKFSKSDMRIFYFSKNKLKFKNITLKEFRNDGYLQNYLLIIFISLLLTLFFTYKSFNKNIPDVIVYQTFSSILFFFLVVILDRKFDIWRGDSFEYMMMLESISNHFTPNMTLADLSSFRSNYPNIHEWFINGLNETNFMKNEGFKSFYGGYFTSLGNEKYSYHFFFYSLINLPMKVVISFLGLDKSYIFIFTHLLLLISLLCVLLKSSLSNSLKVFLSLIFCVSNGMYYFFWCTPEFMTSVMVFISCVLFFDKKYYGATIICSLASVHNNSLIFLSVYFLFYDFLIKLNINNFNMSALKSIMLKSILPFLIFLSPMFYFYFLFRVPSLIVDAGYIAHNSSVLLRSFDFIFDLNQGVFWGFPFVFVFIVFILLWQLKVGKFDVFLAFGWLIAIILQVVIVSNVYNWNNGCTVIFRYGSWMFMPFFAFAIYYSFTLLKNGVLISSFLLVSQVYSFSLNHNFKGLDEYLVHSRLAKYVLSRYPAWYNPEPETFAERTLHTEDIKTKNSPIIFKDENGVPTKLLLDTKVCYESIDPNITTDSLNNEWKYWKYIDLK